MTAGDAGQAIPGCNTVSYQRLRDHEFTVAKEKYCMHFGCTTAVSVLRQ